MQSSGGIPFPPAARSPQWPQGCGQAASKVRAPADVPPSAVTVPKPSCPAGPDARHPSTASHLHSGPELHLAPSGVGWGVGAPGKRDLWPVSKCQTRSAHRPQPRAVPVQGCRPAPWPFPSAPTAKQRPGPASPPSCGHGHQHRLRQPLPGAPRHTLPLFGSSLYPAHVAGWRLVCCPGPFLFSALAPQAPGSRGVRRPQWTRYPFPRPRGSLFPGHSVPRRWQESSV